MKTIGVGLMICALLLQGCAELILREHDSAGMKTAKVVGRVLAWPVTLGLSEVNIGIIKQREELDNSQRQAQVSQRNYFDGLVGRLTYSEALVKWGHPAQSETHGAVIVAVWQSRRASTGYLSMPPIRGNPYSSSLAVALPEYGSRMQLVFDQETERLRSWSVQNW